MYICDVISRIHRFRTWIGCLWLGAIFLSLGVIALHRHDTVEPGESYCQEQHGEHHQHSEDCAYCFLYFKQGVDRFPSFTDPINPREIALSPRVIGSPISAYFQYRFYTVGLRGPPQRV